MRRRFFKVGHRDKAEPAIINALVAAGDSVAQISGTNLPDLAVGSKGVTYLLEIKSEIKNTKKDGYTRTSRGKLKAGQEDFRLSWLGGPVVVAYTPEEALQKVGHSPVEIALAREWSKDWTRRLTPEQRAALVRALPGYTPPRGPGVDAARLALESFAPHVCAACQIDPQTPCKHDGEEQIVALGIVPPRRVNQRAVDRIMAEQERLRRVGSTPHR